MPGETEVSIRDTISNAITTLESGGDTSQTPSTPSAPTPAPGPSGTPAAPAAAGTPGAPPAYGAPAPTPPAATGTPAAPVAPPGSIPPKDGAATPPVDKQNVPTVVAEKAPGTWTPEAREHWAALPEGVRKEVIKREREVSQAMTRSTKARQFQSEFDQAILPYMGFIAAEKSTPIQAAVNMMQTAALLRTGTKQAKAQMVAHVIQQHGVDLQLLDGLLAGQQPGNDAESYIQSEIERRMKPYQTHVQTNQQHQEQFMQQIDQEVGTELEQFAAANEFYDDVKEIMADMIESSDKRGVNLSLTDAYARATLLHEPVRLVVEQRKGISAAQRGHQLAQQARSGAISVKPSDETGVTTIPVGDSIRDSLNYAFEKHGGR